MSESGIGIGMEFERSVAPPEPVFVESRVSIRRSDKVDKLIPALIAAQLEYDVVAKDAENEFFSKGARKSKYATLDSAVSATRPYLNKHGLTIIQHLTSSNRDKELTVTTCLYHISEQFFESELTLPAAQGAKFDPQTLASASTYGRRITWLAISGAAPGDDDDGNKASGNEGSREAAQSVAKEKIEALKAAKAQQDPSVGPPQLCFYLADDHFEVTGMPDVMEAHKELLLHYGKRTKEIDKITGKPKPVVVMYGNEFDAFKYEFVDNRKGILVKVPGAKIAEVAKEMARG